MTQGFGPDDIPATRADMSKLWLRRFRYDPADFFSVMEDLPYLAIFGAKDVIVPVEENVAVLSELGDNVRAVIVPESGACYDHDAQSLVLPNGELFWLFEGPDVGFTGETVEFLRRGGFLLR